ncbi:hypothetical protein [Azospirillum sp. B506]|uniref:hypothetical protein n=1 Tax=Azospirillum sp. B506 TaxID=137721 RepID=UPI00034C6E34|nr:hypothetical protein [Azospirillum sp. B506]
MTDYFSRRAKALKSVNDTFSKLKSAVEAEVAAGATSLEVAEVAQKVGISIAERDLGALGIPPVVDVLTFVPWNVWFPWQALYDHYLGEVLPASPAVASKRAAAAGRTLAAAVSVPMP